MTIRLPPAVARVASKEKNSVGYITNVTSSPIPTSQPNITTSLKEGKGILLWGSKGKDGREKWESGVIGREKARVIIDMGNTKRFYHV